MPSIAETAASVNWAAPASPIAVKHQKAVETRRRREPARRRQHDVARALKLYGQDNAAAHKGARSYPHIDDYLVRDEDRRQMATEYAKSRFAELEAK